MKPLISPNAMRDMEQRYFAATGTPSIDLMERAAQALCDCLVQRYGRGRQVWFACGPGGNGGDGYACARLYAAMGGTCALFPASPPRTPDAMRNRERALAAGIPELTLRDALSAPEIWVDALYGTGLSRAPGDTAAELIDRINTDHSGGSCVIAADIPSGLNGLSGSAFEPCIQADLTLSFQFEKTGLRLSDGLDVCGEIQAADIGIPPEFYPGDLAYLLEASDVRQALPPKPRNAHKGKNGHLLIVAGSAGMAGAAALCAGAALRSGVGLVTLACPASILQTLQALVPCAMAVPLPDTGGAIDSSAVDALQSTLSGKHAVVCGCGLSRHISPRVIKQVLECGLPALFDADALNVIAASAGLRAALKPCHLITPHPGEAARLLGRVPGDPVADAFSLRDLGCQVLLKGATSIVPVNGHAWLSASGSCGMAKGGSGDVLAGLTGGLMAQYAAGSAEPGGDALAACAAFASEIHGLAGELAQERIGRRGMCATDIIDALPAALRAYE